MESKNEQATSVEVPQSALNAKAPQTTPVSWDTPKIVALLISVASLAVSLFVFYFQNVQVRHDLKGDLYYLSLNDALEPGVLKGEFLVSNSGNQVEVVRSVDFVLGAAPECWEGSVFSAVPVPAPITLKPGESTVLKLSVAISENRKTSAKEMKFRPGGTFERQAYLCGLFNVVGPNGEADSTMYKFGAVQVDADGTLQGPYDHPTTDHGLISLPGPRAVPKAKPVVVYAPAAAKAKQ